MIQDSTENLAADTTGLFSDWSVNNRNIKAQLILLAYRCCRSCWKGGRLGQLLGIPLFVFYRITVEWILGVELGWRVSVGPRLRLYHAIGLVVHPSSLIGADCILRHSTTLGTKRRGGGVPRLGNSVDVGCNSVILGEIYIGDNSIVAAGSVVTADISPNTIVAGNPARPIGTADKIVANGRSDEGRASLRSSR